MSTRTKADSGAELLVAGEGALERGDSRTAFALLERATRCGVPPALLDRLAARFATAGRFTDRHAEVLSWLERAIADAVEPPLRVALLRARISACRQLDLHRVLELVDEAAEAAAAAGDEEAYASCLSNAAFASYRRGDARAASAYAERITARPLTTLAARYDALRAQLFAASARGDLEEALNLATKQRALARELGRTADVANESNNLAEVHAALGYPAEARACAAEAIRIGAEAGHRAAQEFGHVLLAVATAELGDLDAALALFDDIDTSGNRLFEVDKVTWHSYWLLERNASGDARRARELAEGIASKADAHGVHNRLTALGSNIARGLAREGRPDQARAALERARQAADRAEDGAQLLLALAVAEVSPADDPRRAVVLNHARARILRMASRREDPRAFCTRVRLHRRILELSGGVPDDLP